LNQGKNQSKAKFNGIDEIGKEEISFIQRKFSDVSDKNFTQKYSQI
jgi:hypothetical protein